MVRCHSGATIPANTPLSLYFLQENILVASSSDTCSTTTGKLTIKVCDEEFSTCGGKANGTLLYIEPNSQECAMDIDFKMDSGLGGGNFKMIASSCKMYPFEFLNRKAIIFFLIRQSNIPIQTDAQ